MLIAHAASTCDVCLEGYSEDCSYHSIPCGHVFCLPCLVSTSPSKCPLCRHEFSAHSVRKVHLTLPSPRDMAARRLELKLVQSSPEMTLAESLMLFQEVQEWLEGEAQDEFLVLRAFAAVMCGFHETKDKLLQTEDRAKNNEALLLRSLDEARSATYADGADYKAKYKAARSELDTLRAECADLRAKAEQAHQRSVDIQAHYAQAQLQAQNQAEAESQPAMRRISNPLPAPPRPIDIPYLKLFESRPSSQTNKGKGKDTMPKDSDAEVDVDPMTSAFVPTLSTSTTTKSSSSSADVRSEVTTLVFKPPKRMPVWDSPNTSYARIEAPPSTHSDSGARQGSEGNPSDQSEYSRSHVRQKVEHPYELSNVDPTRSERSHRMRPPPRPVSYAEGTDWTNPASIATGLPTATGLLSRHIRLQSQAQSSKHGDRHEYEPPVTLAALQRPESYASSPRITSRVNWEASSASVARPTLPVASRHREPGLIDSGDTVRGFGLRRASSPAFTSSHTNMHIHSDDVPVPVPHEDRRRVDRRVVPELQHTNVMDGDGPVFKADETHHRRRTSPSLGDSQETTPRARRPEGDSRRANIQNEPALSRGQRPVGFPLSPRMNLGEDRPHENIRHNDATPISYGYSRPITSHVHHAAPRPPSPTPIRERAYSHSHLYAAPPFPPSRRNAGDISPANRRLILDLSIAGPGATFHIMDPNGPRAVPVPEV